MMIVTFTTEIPVANPVRFTQEGVNDNQRANFDQVRFSQARNTGMDKRIFFQPFENADPMRPQFYSNFPLNRVRLIDCNENVLFEGIPDILIQYRNKKYRSGCKFANYNGKLFIYFEDEFEYLDVDFQVPGPLISHQGRLPEINAQAGDLLRYQIEELGFANTAIQSIIWNTDLQAEGYLTDVATNLVSSVDGVVEVTYNEKPVDLYIKAIDWSALPEGIYYIRLSFGVTDYIDNWLSEPIDLKALHKETLAIDYRHSGQFDQEDLWGYVYPPNFFNRIRIPSNHCAITPSGEREVYNDDFGVQKQTRAVPFRQITFKAFDLPGWVIDKFNLIFAHDTKMINAYRWENEDFGNFNIIDRTDIGDFEINLRQVDDRTKVISQITIEIP